MFDDLDPFYWEPEDLCTPDTDEDDDFRLVTAWENGERV
jgi:hypothetical protein